MSINELTTYYDPRHTKRVLMRRWSQTTTRYQRYLHTVIRRIRRNTLAAIRRQYYITTAVRDFSRAVTLNEDIFIAAVIVAVVVGYGCFIVATQLLVLLTQAAFALMNATGFGVDLFIVIAIGVLGTVGGWVATFLLNNLAIAAMEGVNRKVRRSIRKTLRQGLMHTSRVFSAWMLLLIRLVGVPCVALLTSALVLRSAHLSPALLIRIAEVGGAAVLIWVAAIIMFYGIVPYVALFEPSVPMSQVFVRSRQLVKNRGHFFVLGIYILVALAVTAAYYASVYTGQLLHLDHVPIFILELIAVFIVSNGIMTAFYRKRKLARTN